MTTFRDVLPNVHLVTATPRDEGVLRPMVEKAKVKTIPSITPKPAHLLFSLNSIWTYTSCWKATWTPGKWKAIMWGNHSFVHLQGPSPPGVGGFSGGAGCCHHSRCGRSQQPQQGIATFIACILFTLMYSVTAFFCCCDFEDEFEQGLSFGGLQQPDCPWWRSNENQLFSTSLRPLGEPLSSP